MPNEGNQPTRTWQEIAEEASREHDPDRLAKLTKELEQALDARDKKPAHTQRIPPRQTASGSGQ